MEKKTFRLPAFREIGLKCIKFVPTVRDMVCMCDSADGKGVGSWGSGPV